jgi:hypothetical protein
MNVYSRYCEGGARNAALAGAPKFAFGGNGARRADNGCTV